MAATSSGDVARGPNGIPLNDKEILENHEAALLKLASLQEGLIGGEKAGM